MSVYRAAIITDIHYGHDTSSKLGTTTPDLLPSVINRINCENSRNPDAVRRVFDLGDRIDARAGVAETTREHMNRVKSYFNQLSCPVTHLPGNHDLRQLTRAENKEITGSLPFSHSFDECGVHVVCFNPGLGLAEPNGVGTTDDDLRWLEDNLKEAAHPVHLFSHFPYGHDGHDGMGGIKKGYAAMRNADVRRVLEASGKVHACWSGHLHKTFHECVGGIHYFGLRALTDRCEQTSEKNVPSGTWAQITIDTGCDVIGVKVKGRVRKGEIVCDPATLGFSGRPCFFATMG